MSLALPSQGPEKASNRRLAGQSPRRWGNGRTPPGRGTKGPESGNGRASSFEASTRPSELTDFLTKVVRALHRRHSRVRARRVSEDLWRGRCTKQEYVDELRRKVERYRPQRVMIESVAAQEYLPLDVEKFAAFDRAERTEDKVSRA